MPGSHTPHSPTCACHASGRPHGVFERVTDVQAAVTFGGGSTIEYPGLALFGSAAKYPASTHFW